MDGFDIFIVGILSIIRRNSHCYLLSHCLSIQWLVTKTKNYIKELLQINITRDKIKEDKFYIVLDNKQVIENSDLLFIQNFDSADIQAKVKRIGDKVEVKTIGYRIHF